LVDLDVFWKQILGAIPLMLGSEGVSTIEHMLHLVAICVTNLGVDKACAGLCEHYALHGARFFCSFDDVLG
jgi:hypothetical protein